MGASDRHGGHNRLIHQTSPYLLQHADNPVDWYPWGPEALEAARQHDVPIFLSVGYSTCHWCHVMAHESFEDPGVAEFLNAHFVPVKVDREERPDLDEIYMAATQLMTGRGGWPNSVFLTPDGRPWYAGTYFPVADHAGMPGFLTVLRRLSELWERRRDVVEAQAEDLARRLRRVHRAEPAGPDTGSPRRQIVGRLLEQLARSADRQHGGFGGAPKFPPHAALSVLLYEYRRTGDAQWAALAGETLDAMARGGIRDHVGGGFHRYATDGQWHVPHFEKMLYDNAQLARAYAQAFALTGNQDYRQVAEETCDWVLAEMTDPAGGFYSALDADSEGVEGKFYLWTRREILEALGRDDGELFARVYDVREDGNFPLEAPGQPRGANIPRLLRPLDETARQEGLAPQELRRRLSAARARLLARRAQRVRPGRDEKVLAGWNGLMISALSVAGEHLDRGDYLAAALRSAEFVLAALRHDNRLRRVWRQGRSVVNANLDDCAFLAEGLLDLHAAGGQPRWLQEAVALTDTMIAHYHDRQEGGFFFTSDEDPPVLVRWKSPFDREVPSGNGVAVRVLVRLAELTGQARYAGLAEGTIEAFWPLMWTSPRGSETLILGAASYLDAPVPAKEDPS